ncbi:hypothetical protein AVEN_44787-1 [Araneus ventricosus]|uniref:Uncharacterized protein n=1 Tax=Araneus ventricosus TaxID=182803 RepID=A0A4Y2TZA4_ARAVE|nr:hypothetical protein AVEN_44787-1 [Araneus ventricosus]
MAYLAGVKKEDLRSLCEDLGLTVTSKMSVIAIRDLIINDTNYDEEFTREHLKMPNENFVTYLISALPGDIAKLIAREPEILSHDYDHIKSMLLERFKLSAEKFRLLFSQHRKTTDSTSKDFYFEVRTYLEGWLTELKIETFEQLKDLIITDQIKKKCPPEYRDHFIDDWLGIISPSELTS